jgi:tetratricopeptide (TPR) repeat protein
MRIALLLAVAVALAPAEKRVVRALLQRSLEEYKSLQFEAALRDIQQAYLLDPRPELLFNVGQCERALHHWERARFAFERYVRQRPDASNRGLVEKLLAEVVARQREELAARAPANPSPPPAPAPVRAIVVAALPSVAPPAPAAAVALAPAPAKRRSHVLAWTFGSLGLAAALAAAYGGYEVLNYDQLASAANTTFRSKPASEVTPAQQSAQLWQPLSIGLAIAAVAGLTAAGFTW